MPGGEPFVYRHLFGILESYPDVAFQIYTNGTLIDDEAADRLAECANVTCSISLEGWEAETDARRGEGTWNAWSGPWTDSANGDSPSEAVSL